MSGGLFRLLALCLQLVALVMFFVSIYRREEAPFALAAGGCVCAAIVAYSLANGAFR